MGYCNGYEFQLKRVLMFPENLGRRVAPLLKKTLVALSSKST
jgi:hypothetical protein